MKNYDIKVKYDILSDLNELLKDVGRYLYKKNILKSDEIQRWINHLGYFMVLELVN